VNVGSAVLLCEGASLQPGESATVTLTVDVAEDAPCALTNTVRVYAPPSGPPNASASDPTTVTGGECGGGDGDGGGSILPIDLSGILPMFNNISINNNIDSPGASNNSHQAFGLNAP
jgi:hypothetical protein